MIDSKRIAYTVTTSEAKTTEGGLSTWVAGRLLYKKKGHVIYGTYNKGRSMMMISLKPL